MHLDKDQSSSNTQQTQKYVIVYGPLLVITKHKVLVFVQTAAAVISQMTEFRQVVVYWTRPSASLDTYSSCLV